MMAFMIEGVISVSATAATSVIRSSTRKGRLTDRRAPGLVVLVSSAIVSIQAELCSPQIAGRSSLNGILTTRV
jgi:hypothetical protein